MFERGTTALMMLAGKWWKDLIQSVAAGLTLSMLAACSSAAPTEADIKQAMLNNDQVVAGFRSAATLEKTLTGRSASPEDAIAEMIIEVQGCAQSADGFICTFRVTRPAPKCGEDVYTDGTPAPCPAGQPITGSWGKARFFKAASGWQMMAAQ